MKKQVICVTNRLLCHNNFLEQIRKIAAGGIDAVILREKDLSQPEYHTLALSCFRICREAAVPLIINGFPEIALHLALPMQLSFSDFLEYMSKDDCLKGTSPIGVSVHSVTEAKLAEAKGAAFLIAGHIFQTNCKPDLMPRGLAFLRQICMSVQTPVWAIGGITPKNATNIWEQGASGVCIMSSLMEAEYPERMIQEIKS